ncbi:MAG: PorV/PorQ family protein [Elusimicrobiota bacterium]|nr:PorV/PorQ family protein [Elusimicrobiota bacterium]
MKKINIILGIVLISTPAIASDPGTSAGVTLLQPVTAKAASMGQACSGLRGDISALNYNPAGMASFTSGELSMMYQRGFAEDNYGSFVFGRKTSYGGFSMSFINYDTGKIEMYDSSGDLITKTGQRDMIFAVGAAKKIFGLPVGVSVKHMSSEIFGNKAKVWAMDAGAQFLGFGDDITIGLAIQNLGGKLQYLNEKETLPLTIRPGASYNMVSGAHKIMFSLDTPYYKNDKETLALIGVDYTYNALSLRSGYRLNLSDSDGEAESFNFGISFDWSTYSFSYATGIIDNLDSPHQLSFTMKF